MSASVHECAEKRAKGERGADFEITCDNGRWVLVCLPQEGAVAIRYCPFCGEALPQP